MNCDRSKRLSCFIVTSVITTQCGWLTGCAATSKFGGANRGQSGTPVQDATLEQYIKIDWPTSGTLTRDGSLYYVKREDGVRQLFRKRPGAEIEETLTGFADGVGGYTASYDGKWLAVLAAPGGNEQFDIYLMDTSTGVMREALIDPETVYGSVVWKRDSSGFAYRANPGGQADFNVFLYSLNDGASRRIWDRPGYWYPTAFSPDESHLIVGEYRSASESYLVELPLDGGSARPLTPEPLTPENEEWSFGAVGYSPDGGTIYAVSNYHIDRQQLFTIDRESLEIRPALPQMNRHEVDGATLSEDRTKLGVVLNVDGYGELRLFSVPDLEPLTVPFMAHGIVGNVDFVGDTLIFSMNNANTPGVIHRWDMNDAAADPTPMTTPDTQGVDVSAFTLPKLVRYRSFDGLEIPAFLYLPSGQKRDKPIRFIISFHGGPESQYRPYFSAYFQYFISRGYGVLAPNVRGSSGYGTAYLEMDNYKSRMASVKDGVAGAQWLVDNGYSAPGMIAAYGGSYGGFMTMAVITQNPRLFGAACNYVGIVNFETFLERTKAYRRKLREAEYGPLSDPEFLKTISPIYLVDRIKTPVFIAHGENDPRVPVYEARQLHEALEANGQIAELLIFPDEGHGFRKDVNRLEFFSRLSDFFDKHLARP